MIELVDSSFKISTFSLGMVLGKSCAAILTAFPCTALALACLSFITVEPFLPAPSTESMIFFIDFSVLGYAVIDKTLLFLNETTFAFL